MSKKPNRKEAFEMIASGMSVTEMVEKTGLGKNTVYQLRHEYNKKYKKKEEKPVDKDNEEMEKLSIEVSKLRNENRNLVIERDKIAESRDKFQKAYNEVVKEKFPIVSENNELKDELETLKKAHRELEYKLIDTERWESYYKKENAKLESREAELLKDNRMETERLLRRLNGLLQYVAVDVS